jgi:2,4-dienoyl-CoA reductase-like NADH-dependent reductase (Old Yellow Enzyme family)
VVLADACLTRLLAAGTADVIAFGVPFLANPDLPERLRRDAPYNVPKPPCFMGSELKWADYSALTA